MNTGGPSASRGGAAHPRRAGRLSKPGEDRIIRQFVLVIKATLRTNFSSRGRRLPEAPLFVQAPAGRYPRHTATGAAV